jgi:hypothetical protein
VNGGTPGERMRRDITARLVVDPSRSRTGIAKELKVSLITVQRVVRELGFVGKGVIGERGGPAHRLFGKKLSAATRRKISENHPKKCPWFAGANNPWYGNNRLIWSGGPKSTSCAKSSVKPTKAKNSRPRIPPT